MSSQDSGFEQLRSWDWEWGNVRLKSYILPMWYHTKSNSEAMGDQVKAKTMIDPDQVKSGLKQVKTHFKVSAMSDQVKIFMELRPS